MTNDKCRFKIAKIPPLDFGNAHQIAQTAQAADGLVRVDSASGDDSHMRFELPKNIAQERWAITL
jgi:hypothetical protein